ncbi:MAG TPA: NAD(P)/FAD-dependent oxidoreductase [Chitinophagaceae bacterium]|jgi:flavin-dependent dehydrogenase|nr:NAD(P)/FAD-dependent oxidoreductase [Chitinophagaceae bacterium]
MNKDHPNKMSVSKLSLESLEVYDVAIVGGGLAGLALSIQCAKAGYKTILFEKEKYPFHKVCGEYISLESWNFLQDLGVPLSEMDLPVIRRLLVTAPNGKELEQDLPLGGFGISRYKLDAMLAEIARRSGVELMEAMKVNNVSFDEEIFNVQYSISNVQCKVSAGTFGKRSNLDIKWKRRFILEKPNKLNNYIGVKYHIKTKWPSDLIALHNFENGYCGISQIEEEKYCLCYLTTAKNLEKESNSIPQMEKQILHQNPHLKKIFSTSEILYEQPAIISQISFAKKTQVQDHVLMIGDAAGMITPLCGNGMSMALHGSKIAFEQIHLFLQKKIPRWQMEQDYANNWQKQFGKRLRTGRMIQRFFGNPILSDLLIFALKPFPRLVDKLIAQTHGQPF